MDKPHNLGPSGNLLWDSVTEDNELGINEAIILSQACQELDLIDHINNQINVTDMTTFGSQGQPVADPLVAELRQHRNTLIQLMKYLKFPEQVAMKSESARASANKRWGTRNAG